jgi:putative serine protease PepD
MTENPPGAGGDPQDGPEQATEHASPGTGQPTGQDSGAMPTQGPTDAPPVSRTGPVAQVPPSPWSSGGYGHRTGQPSGPEPSGQQPGGPQPSQQSGYHQALPQSQQPLGQQPQGQQPQGQYSPSGQQQGQPYGLGTPPHGYGYLPPDSPPTGPITTGYPLGGLPLEPRRRGPGGLVVGVAVLALVVGGLAGGLGGYLVSGHSRGDVVSSLSQPSPASQTANAPSGSAQDVANKVLPVVVTIAAEFQSQGNVSGDTGSGVIISSDGDVLTNNHVIAGAASGGRIQVIFANGKTVDASIVGRDPTTDVAVIRAKNVTGLPVAALGRSDDLTVGESVVAIGAPFELSGTVTSGIVSSLHRPTEAGDGSDASQTTVLDAIQTDAPINPGNSGGPLVNMRSQVVGINSAIYSPNTSSQTQSQGGNVGIGFAIPIEQAKRTANEIVKTGKAIQTVLGVKVIDNTPSSGGQPSILPNGALIRDVTPGGPADKAGLKAGAVVVRTDSRLVNSSDGLVAAVHAAAPGDQMKLTLNNGSTVTVTLSGQQVNPN